MLSAQVKDGCGDFLWLPVPPRTWISEASRLACGIYKGREHKCNTTINHSYPIVSTKLHDPLYVHQPDQCQLLTQFPG